MTVYFLPLTTLFEVLYPSQLLLLICTGLIEMKCANSIMEMDL
jgi:hypothetical protein